MKKLLVIAVLFLCLAPYGWSNVELYTFPGVSFSENVMGYNVVGGLKFDVPIGITLNFPVLIKKMNGRRTYFEKKQGAVVFSFINSLNYFVTESFSSSKDVFNVGGGFGLGVRSSVNDLKHKFDVDSMVTVGPVYESFYDGTKTSSSLGLLILPNINVAYVFNSFFKLGLGLDYHLSVFNYHITTGLAAGITFNIQLWNILGFKDAKLTGIKIDLKKKLKKKPVKIAKITNQPVTNQPVTNQIAVKEIPNPIIDSNKILLAKRMKEERARKENRKKVKESISNLKLLLKNRTSYTNIAISYIISIDKEKNNFSVKDFDVLKLKFHHIEKKKVSVFNNFDNNPNIKNKPKYLYAFLTRYDIVKKRVIDYLSNQSDVLTIRDEETIFNTKTNNQVNDNTTNTSNDARVYALTTLSNNLYSFSDIGAFQMSYKFFDNKDYVDVSNETNNRSLTIFIVDNLKTKRNIEVFLKKEHYK